MSFYLCLLTLSLDPGDQGLVRDNLDLYVTWKQIKIEKTAFPAKYSQNEVSMFF